MEQNQLTPFAFGDNMLRVRMDENGNPWFVAKDVCRVLDITNNRDAVAGLDDDEKITVANSDGNPRAGIPHEMTLISESGLYALVFRSRKPEAKAFSKWVRAEVLPALRKTGSYAMQGGLASRRAALPDDLPPEALSLRPAMRQRLWENALQTARLDGGGSTVAQEWFVRLCRLMTAGGSLGGEDDLVGQFLHECCLRDNDAVHTSEKLWKAFFRWCVKAKGMNRNNIKSLIRFSKELNRRDDIRKIQTRPVTKWLGIRLKPEWNGKLAEQ